MQVHDTTNALAAQTALDTVRQTALDTVRSLIFLENKPQDGRSMLAAMPVAARNSPRARCLALAGHGMAGKTDAFLRLLSDLSMDPAVREHARTTCLRLLLWAKLPSAVLVHKVIWGPLPTSLMNGFIACKPAALAPELADNLLQTARNLPGVYLADPEEWLFRARVGHERARYSRFLRGVRTTTDDPSPEASDLLHIASQSAAILDSAGSSGYPEFLRCDRSLVVLCAHSGPVDYDLLLVKTTKLPLSFIVDPVHPAQSPDEFNVSVLADDMAFRFARLCKLMRRAPRIAVIFPDGGRGAHSARHEIAGRSVKIGLGAAALAFFGKAQYVFASPRFTETGIAVDFTFGPCVDQRDTMLDAERKLVAFYADCYSNMLQGDPINFGLRGDYWHSFMGIDKS